VKIKDVGLWFSSGGNVFILVSIFWTRFAHQELTETQLFLRFWWLYAIGLGLTFMGLYLVARKVSTPANKSLQQTPTGGEKNQS
jgi:hypothetical protein